MANLLRGGNAKPRASRRRPGYRKEENMRRALVLLIIEAIQVGLCAGLAAVGTLDFTDDFDSFDTNSGTTGSQNLRRSYLDPNNIGTGDGNLAVKLPANSLNGGDHIERPLQL